MKEKLCIATYNVRHGGDVTDDVGCIGRLLAEHGVDVAGLQEIDVGTNRMCAHNVLEEIAKGGNYPHCYFAKAMDFDCGGYGVGIVSRYPILWAQTIPLYSGGEEPRVLCHAVIETGEGTLDFFNTHTSYESREIRARQLKEIGKHLSAHENFILTGAFNTADLEEFSVFPTCTAANRNAHASFYATGEGIDNIFVSPNFGILKTEMIKVPHSDHYPILSLVEKK